MTDEASIHAQGERSLAAGSIQDSLIVTGDDATVNVTLGMSEADKTETVQAYLIDRFLHDATLKFKQTDLESQEIQQLYIDLPLIKMESRYYDEESALERDASMLIAVIRMLAQIAPSVDANFPDLRKNCVPYCRLSLRVTSAIVASTNTCKGMISTFTSIPWIIEYSLGVA